jgi:hypothetical protein
MHRNKALLIGRVGERGVKVTYSERAIPTCSFILEIEGRIGIKKQSPIIQPK